ncbi:MAG: hypothetical protein A49_30820 [Methyloceanibacter sp.]|nr:MAG: hypothetical protein A49_30820 [Methyloceanibacter sp.]
MMDASSHSFRKMNGLGNDFVVIDRRADALDLPAETVRAIADRETGVGCDQLIALDPSSEADVFMRIWNADGGEVAACGNAARCVAGIVAQELGRANVTIETEDQVLGAFAGAGEIVTIDMGEPRLAWDEIPLAEEFHDTSRIELQAGPIDAPVLHSPGVVSMGNPHAIFFRRRCGRHRTRPDRPDAGAPSAVSRARQYLRGASAEPRPIAFADLGAGRGADARLRHRGLRFRGRGGQAGLDGP